MTRALIPPLSATRLSVVPLQLPRPRPVGGGGEVDWSPISQCKLNGPLPFPYSTQIPCLFLLF